MTDIIQQYATELWQDYDLANGPEIAKIMDTQRDLISEVKTLDTLAADPAKTILANTKLNSAAANLVYNGTLNIAYAIKGLVEVTCKKLSNDWSFMMRCRNDRINMMVTFDYDLLPCNFVLQFPINPQSKEQLLSWYMDPLAALLGKEFTFGVTYTTAYHSCPTEQFVDFKDLYKAIKKRVL